MARRRDDGEVYGGCSGSGGPYALYGPVGSRGLGPGAERRASSRRRGEGEGRQGVGV